MTEQQEDANMKNQQADVTIHNHLTDGLRLWILRKKGSFKYNLKKGQGFILCINALDAQISTHATVCVL